MTKAETVRMIAEMGLPYSYHHFAEGESPDPPFLLYLYPESDNFAADGATYYKIDRLHLELYTDRKSPDIEDAIESILDGRGLFYNKSEVWISSEKLYEVLYQTEV